MLLRRVLLISALLLGNMALAEAGNAPNSQPDPYRAIRDFFRMPPGRAMGSTNSVALDHEGHIWVVDRCGANDCAGSKLDPVMEFDANGNFIKAFGAGKMLFPHGMTIDKDDHIWVCDGHVGQGIGDDGWNSMRAARSCAHWASRAFPARAMTPSTSPTPFWWRPMATSSWPMAMNPARATMRGWSSSIPNGKFILQWGGHGNGPGQFEMPHALAMDNEGRLFVADRGNNRVQIFDQNGKFIAAWSQFSRPCGVFVDSNDVLYVTDSESTTKPGYGYNPKFVRGMRIGSAKTGQVDYFIPDPDLGHANPDTSAAEGVWVDPNGVIYGAEVGPKAVIRYVKK